MGGWREVRPMKQKEIGNSHQAAQREGDLGWVLQGSREDLLLFTSFAFFLCFGSFDFRNLQFFCSFYLPVLEKQSRLDSKVKQ